MVTFVVILFIVFLLSILIFNPQFEYVSLEYGDRWWIMNYNKYKIDKSGIHRERVWVRLFGVDK